MLIFGFHMHATHMLMHTMCIQPHEHVHITHMCTCTHMHAHKHTGRLKHTDRLACMPARMFVHAPSIWWSNPVRMRSDSGSLSTQASECDSTQI